MLAVSYGPGWRVPDPSFRHEPGPEVTERFDGWFGSLMRNRRDWERYLADRQATPRHGPSDFAALGGRPAGRRRSGSSRSGAGSGADALALAERGFEVLGLDYARHSLRPPARGQAARAAGVVPRDEPLRPARRADARRAAGPAPRRPQAVYARELLEALDPDGLDELLALHQDGCCAERWPRLPRGRVDVAPTTAPSGAPSTAAGGCVRSTRAWSRVEAVRLGRPGGAPGRASSKRARPCGAARRRGGG